VTDHGWQEEGCSRHAVRRRQMLCLPCKDDSRELAELKQQKSKRLILLRSTFTLWQCAAKAFLIFAVLDLQVHGCRPYMPFKLFSFFPLIKVKVENFEIYTPYTCLVPGRLEWLSYHMLKNITLSRFGTIQERDRQTYRQTGRIAISISPVKTAVLTPTRDK